MLKKRVPKIRNVLINNLSAGASTTKRRTYLFYISFIIAIIGGVLHRNHVYILFENSLTFSHLSNLEREISFRSEQGFYYSFFKQIIHANTFWEGFMSLFNDTQTEYPDVLGCLHLENGTHGYLPVVSICQKNSTTFNSGITTLERFNLYPEVFLAALYRIASNLDILFSICYVVDRGEVNNYQALALQRDDIISLAGGHLQSPLLKPLLPKSGSSLVSCDGNKEPPIFYVSTVFWVAALSVFGLGLSGWLVGSAGSSPATQTNWLEACLPLWATLLPITAFFFNHGEATRVQWAPTLRESFSYPFFLLQQTTLLWLLRTSIHTNGRPWRLWRYFLLGAFLLSFQLPWQFAQFTLFTQLFALLAAYLVSASLHLRVGQDSLRGLRALSSRIVGIFWCHLVVLLLSWALQLGNRLLLTTEYLPALIASLIALIWHYRVFLCDDRKAPCRRKYELSGNLVHSLAVLLLIAVLTVFGKYLISLVFHLVSSHRDLDDGGHIFDMLKVKLFGAAFRNFHTQLYLCAEEFDFMKWSTISKIWSTGLLGGVVFAIMLTMLNVAWRLMKRSEFSGDSSKTSATVQIIPTELTSSHDACLLADMISMFILFQLGVFTILAVLVMRLKLFWTPQLCLSLALLGQPRLWFGWGPHLSEQPLSTPLKSGCQKGSNWRPFLLHSVMAAFLAFSSLKGTENIQKEREIQFQFSSLPLETLINWASDLPAHPNEGRPWVFSGAMPHMATLRLTLIVSSEPGGTPLEPRFAITNHPHYENSLLRARTILASAICGRKPIRTVWQIYRHLLQADFVVVPYQWCMGGSRGPGCRMVEICDLLDPQFTERPCIDDLSTNAASTDLGAALSDHLQPYFTLVFRAHDDSLFVFHVSEDSSLSAPNA